jgi:hypothetical protein
MSAELQNAAFGLIACRIPTLKISFLLFDIQSWFDVNKPLVLPTPPGGQTPPPPRWAYQAKSFFDEGSFKKMTQAKRIENFPLHSQIPPPLPPTTGFRHNH